MNRVTACLAILVGIALSVPRLATARQETAAGEGVDPPKTTGAPPVPSVDGPPPPVPPAVITRDEARRATIRAVRLAVPLRVDGALDEDVYQTVPPIDDFIQHLPLEGQPATERTEAWIMFDAKNVYVAARCWDSAPPDQWIANELRRDNAQLRQNDTFGVLFDTFHDRRNGFLFYTNPLGALADQAVTDEGNANADWNPVWQVRTGRFEGGWTVELAVPFKSLRYRAGESQTWGVQLRRAIRRKNEWNYLTPVPAAGTDGSFGMFRISVAATLVGLDLPSSGRRIEVKPYAISRVTTDRNRTPPVLNDADGDAGIDVKYGVTSNLTADLTYNTDFAQVEVDEQQLNLTRFNLQFPEKRDFFLEGRGVFDFGRPGRGGSSGTSSTANTPILFFSRRIGLNRGRVVSIDGGGRLTGKVGKFGVGLVGIRTGDEPVSDSPATSYAVIRVKRDILRRSSVGAIFTNRSASAVDPGSNQAYGADAAFSFYQDVHVNGYIARTRTTGLERDDTSYLGRFDYGADRYGLQLEHLYVGDNFNPEVGFLRREDFRRTYGSARFSPRPQRLPHVRRFSWEADLEYILNGAGALETRQQQGRFSTEFESSDQLTLEVGNNYELITQPFSIGRATIPAGAYRFRDLEVYYAFGGQRRTSGTVSFRRGSFYDGTITAIGYSRGRISVTKHLSLEPTLSLNRLDLPGGVHTVRLLRTRADYAFTPRMFASGLFQYNSSDRTFSTNLRLRWEYQLGSELFVVYTDERDTGLTGAPVLQNRALVFKINRLFRF